MSFFLAPVDISLFKIVVNPQITTSFSIFKSSILFYVPPQKARGMAIKFNGGWPNLPSNPPSPPFQPPLPSRVLPILAYIEKLLLEGVPFSGLRYIKSKGFH